MQVDKSPTSKIDSGSDFISYLDSKEPEINQTLQKRYSTKELRRNMRGLSFDESAMMLRPSSSNKKQSQTTPQEGSRTKSNSAFGDSHSSTRWSRRIRGLFNILDKNGDGFISMEEAHSALSDPSFLKRDAAAIAALHRLLDLLEELSNDEYLDENDGLTMSDLIAYEQGMLHKNLKESLPSVSNAYYEGKIKISRTSRKLFSKGVPTLSALKQADIGDCYFLAALGSFIYREPKALVKMIKEIKQGGKVVSYQVTFPGKLGKVTIKPPTDGELARYSSAMADGLWLTVMEKAYATASAGIKNPDIQKEIGEGGLMSTGLSAFTQAGIDTDILSLTKKSTTKKKLNAAFGLSSGGSTKRRLVTADIKTDNDYGLPGPHAYSVIGWDGNNLKIRNPWGKNDVGSKKTLQGTGKANEHPYFHGIFLMSLDEFDNIFFAISYEES